MVRICQGLPVPWRDKLCLPGGVQGGSEWPSTQSCESRKLIQVTLKIPSSANHLNKIFWFVIISEVPYKLPSHLHPQTATLSSAPPWQPLPWPGEIELSIPTQPPARWETWASSLIPLNLSLFLSPRIMELLWERVGMTMEDKPLSSTKFSINKCLCSLVSLSYDHWFTSSFSSASWEGRVCLLSVSPAPSLEAYGW